MFIFSKFKIFQSRNLVIAIIFGLAAFSQTALFAQKKAVPPKAETKTGTVKITAIDDAKIKEILKPNGKPLLVNFWATWCDPCREEFPDLVKIENDYRGKLDVVTISLDDVLEINTTVTKFLSEMKAETTNYLLVSEDESALISSITKDWSGGMPFTVLYNEKGELTYFRQGKFNTETLKSEIEKNLIVEASQLLLLELPKPKIRSTEDGREEAKNDIAKGVLRIKRYGFTAAIPQASLEKLKQKYNIEVTENGCIMFNVDAKYFLAYNETMKSEIVSRYGSEIIKELPL